MSSTELVEPNCCYRLHKAGMATVAIANLLHMTSTQVTRAISEQHKAILSTNADTEIIT